MPGQAKHDGSYVSTGDGAPPGGREGGRLGRGPARDQAVYAAGQGSGGFPGEPRDPLEGGLWRDGDRALASRGRVRGPGLVGGRLYPPSLSPVEEDGGAPGVGVGPAFLNDV
ncbi:MAG: hypothetical protein LBU69_01170 [Deltaproteobacteria bacterium]|nr:hypothetical protein [Deltaproteobacteria bacterium]